MSKVIGIEGRHEDRVLVWGTPAVAHDLQLINPVSGRVSSLTEVDRLVRDGHLMRLPFPVEVDDEHLLKPLVALLIRHAEPVGKLLLRDTGKLGGLVAHGARSSQQVYVFESLRAFDLYASEVVNELLKIVLFDEQALPRQRELLDLALVLHATHPAVHAIRASFAERPALAIRLAHASLTNDEDRQRCQEIFEAATSDDDDYVLHYADEPATSGADLTPTRGGGFDVEVAAVALTGISRHHRETVEPALRHRFPFLDRRLATPRFHEMKAASAELHFHKQVPGQTKGDRIARHLSLRWLERALRGEHVSVLSPKEQERVAQIAQPTPGIVLRQRPLGRADEEAVAVPVTQPSVSQSVDQLDLLAVQSGVLRDATHIEVHLSERRRIVLSVDDNEFGEAPLGIAYLHERQNFLWQPLVLSVERRIDAHGTENLSLQAVEPLEVGRSKSLVTAVPSSVISGAYYRCEVEIERLGDGSVQTSIGLVDGLALPERGANRETALRAVRQWEQMVLELELADTDTDAGDRWIAPARAPRPLSHLRVVWALGNAGGHLPVSELVATINAEFATSIRVNNTRREVYRHTDLLEFRRADKHVIALTERGRRFYRVMTQILGGAGFSPR